MSAPNGELHHLWRAVDHQGEVLKSVMPEARNKADALKLMRSPGFFLRAMEPA